MSGSLAACLNASAEATATTGNSASSSAEARRVESSADEAEEEVSGCVKTAPPCYDVFINHRWVDTRHTVAQHLLHDRLLQLSGGQVRTFLHSMSLRPGDRLVEGINQGMSQCKVAVAIFSERYLDSEFCLHELAALVEARKVIVPIFYGVKPSALVLPQAVVHTHAPRDVERFRVALREAKYTVGLAYDPATGYVTSRPDLATPNNLLYGSMHAPFKFSEPALTSAALRALLCTHAIIIQLARN